MAWKPEITVDFKALLMGQDSPDLLVMFDKMISQLAPLGTTWVDGKAHIEAHCVLLEPRK
jgi:hypothetical protein